MKRYADLLQRVKAATGPDRALSRDLSQAFGLIGHYTASLDAALAAVERMLPGWNWNIGHDANDELHATVWHGVAEHDEYAPIAPLAIIAALLTALEATDAQS